MAKRIKITEEQLRLLREAVSTLKEGKELLSEVQTKKDNFTYWAKYIDDFIAKNGANNDLVWFIQIMKRRKDNPNMNKSGNYHAGAEYGTFQGGSAFLVHDGNELLNIKQQVVTYCDKNNARAVIFANPRSESDVNNFMPQFKKRFGSNDPRNIYAKEVLMGQVKHDPNKFPTRTACKFDIDETDPMIQKLAKIIIKHYDPNAVFIEDQSPSGGLHIGISDGYAKHVPEMIKMLKIADAEPKRSGGRDYFPDKGVYQTIHFNPDANFILYSNVDTKGYN